MELDEQYACLAEKRLALADEDESIQGYADGVFWERNTLAEQKNGQSLLAGETRRLKESI